MLSVSALFMFAIRKNIRSCQTRCAPLPSRDYTVRGQSDVWRLPKYWPSTGPLICTPRLWCGGRTHSLGGEGDGGRVNILEDARHSSVLYICKYFVTAPIFTVLFKVLFSPKKQVGSARWTTGVVHQCESTLSTAAAEPPTNSDHRRPVATPRLVGGTPALAAWRHRRSRRRRQRHRRQRPFLCPQGSPPRSHIAQWRNRFHLERRDRRLLACARDLRLLARARSPSPSAREISVSPNARETSVS